ncbi:hypothetical protein L209DRAFT_85681 [Thermothelomyces heterothallicus CBS 203.75]
MTGDKKKRQSSLDSGTGQQKIDPTGTRTQNLYQPRVLALLRPVSREESGGDRKVTRYHCAIRPDELICWGGLAGLLLMMAGLLIHRWGGQQKSAQVMMSIGSIRVVVWMTRAPLPPRCFRSNPPPPTPLVGPTQPLTLDYVVCEQQTGSSGGRRLWACLPTAQIMSCAVAARL